MGNNVFFILDNIQTKNGKCLRKNIYFIKTNSKAIITLLIDKKGDDFFCRSFRILWYQSVSSYVMICI